MDVGDTVCVPQAIPRRSALQSEIDAVRRSRTMRFVGGDERLRSAVDPVTLYRVAFKREPDERVVAGLYRMFEREARRIVEQRQRDEPGFVYCFHELADPPNVLKIGRTSRTPDERIAEWERELSPEDGRSVILLFAHRTRHNVFAERVVQRTLFCERIAKRINEHTGDELEEFFELDNALATSIFVRQCLDFVDRWCANVAARGRRPL